MNHTDVVAFAFGVPADILSNRRIAAIASKKAKEFGAPVYTQLDVRVEPGIKVSYTEEKPGNPPPTLRIARDAVHWARRRGITRLWVVAAKPHLRRAVRDLEYVIYETNARLKVRPCEEIELYPEEEWFCSDSTQPRTNSAKAWRSRERILQRLPMFVYKLVAS